MRLTDEHRAEITYWIRENMSPGDELTTDQIADLEALLESEREWMEEAKRNRWAVSFLDKLVAWIEQEIKYSELRREQERIKIMKEVLGKIRLNYLKVIE